MQKLYILLLFILFSVSLNAQLTNCDGTRYIDPIFDDIKITSGVNYGIGTDATGTDFDLLMDVYEPAGDDNNGARPIVIMAHGGSFLFGTRGNPYMIESCTELAKRGYVAASIDYSLWPLLFGIPDSIDLLGTVVDAVDDMKSAVRFFRQDAEMENQFNVESNIILVGGLSAGAIIACQVGIMDDQDEKPQFLQELIDANGGINGNGSHQGFSSNVNGIINFSGGVYKTDWIEASDAPIFSMHGTNDETVPYNHGLAAGIMSINGSGSVEAAAQAVGLNSALVSIEGGGHTDIYTEPAFADAQQELVEVMFPFLEDIVCNYVTSIESLDNISLSVLPNPSSDIISIELPVDITDSFDFMVYDQMGRIIQTRQNITARKITLSKDAIGSGMFYVTLRFEENYNTVTRKILFK